MRGGLGGGGGFPKDFPGERFVVVFVLKGTMASEVLLAHPENPVPGSSWIARPTTGLCDTKRKRASGNGGQKNEPVSTTRFRCFHPMGGVWGGNRWEQVGTGFYSTWVGTGGETPQKSGNTPEVA